MVAGKPVIRHLLLDPNTCKTKVEGFDSEARLDYTAKSIGGNRGEKRGEGKGKDEGREGGKNWKDVANNFSKATSFAEEQQELPQGPQLYTVYNLKIKV